MAAMQKKAAVIYCLWLKGDSAYEVHLLTSKAKINALGMKNMKVYGAPQRHTLFYDVNSDYDHGSIKL